MELRESGDIRHGFRHFGPLAFLLAKRLFPLFRFPFGRNMKLGGSNDTTCLLLLVLFFSLSLYLSVVVHDRSGWGFMGIMMDVTWLTSICFCSVACGL